MRNFGKCTVIRGQEKFCDFRSVRRMKMAVYQCRDCGGTCRECFADWSKEVTVRLFWKRRSVEG